MFESPVKQNLSLPILAKMYFFYSRQRVSRQPAANYLECFTCTRQRAWPVSLCQCHVD